MSSTPNENDFLKTEIDVNLYFGSSTAWSGGEASIFRSRQRVGGRSESCRPTLAPPGQPYRQSCSAVQQRGVLLASKLPHVAERCLDGTKSRCRRIGLWTNEFWEDEKCNLLMKSPYVEEFFVVRALCYSKNNTCVCGCVGALL